MRRHRNAKIIATLGPASSTEARIRALFVAGVDVFRLNFSHGDQSDHRARVETIRALEATAGRPIGILLDLQGPKLRLGRFKNDAVQLAQGQTFRLDLNDEQGDETRAPLPHQEVFTALRPGTDLLLDDGKIRLEVTQCGANFAETIVKAGGPLSNNKGVNVPGVVLALSPLTDKDRSDLSFGLELGVDWVAPSFIQRREDLLELRQIVGDQAFIISKLEKPAAIDRLDDIVELSDGLMVARGDLGVELQPEQVPAVQKRVIRACRDAGKPVVVATQMLESMIHAPIPTRAEASDVAVAIYDGADAVMLSAETAVGEYPVEAVTIMDRVVTEVERDPYYRIGMDTQLPEPDATVADATCDALRTITQTLSVAATVTYTSSGFSSLRAARERPDAPIICLTPHMRTARRLCMVWGVHSVQSEDIRRVGEMVNKAMRAALTEGFADDGDIIVIMAGMPFGHSGTTNLIRIAQVKDGGEDDA